MRGLRILWVAGIVVLLPLVASAVPAQLTDSYIVWPATHAAAYVEVQFFLIDNSTSIDGTGPNGGEAGEAGDWSKPFDARGNQAFSIYAFEYGGTAEITIWDCVDPKRAGVAATVPAIGTVDPAETSGADETDPLCVDVTAGALVTILGTAGTGIRKFSLSERMFSYIVVRLEACAATCDLRVWGIFGN